MKLFEEFKLYENMWETASTEAETPLTSTANSEPLEITVDAAKKLKMPEGTYALMEDPNDLYSFYKLGENGNWYSGYDIGQCANSTFTTFSAAVEDAITCLATNRGHFVFIVLIDDLIDGDFNLIDDLIDDDFDLVGDPVPVVASVDMNTPEGRRIFVTYDVETGLRTAKYILV